MTTADEGFYTDGSLSRREAEALTHRSIDQPMDTHRELLWLSKRRLERGADYKDKTSVRRPSSDKEKPGPMPDADKCRRNWRKQTGVSSHLERSIASKRVIDRFSPTKVIPKQQQTLTTDGNCVDKVKQMLRAAQL